MIFTKTNNIPFIFLLRGLADSALTAIFTKSSVRKVRFVFPVQKNENREGRDHFYH